MLNFSIRSLGMSMFSLIVCGTGIWANFAFPAALDALGWRLFVINAGWNMLFLAFMAYFWVEVQGKTLEEIDALFDGGKHSNVPNVEDVLRGTAEEGWREKIADWMRAHAGPHRRLRMGARSDADLSTRQTGDAEDGTVDG
jgi:hypothetical protein